MIIFNITVSNIYSINQDGSYIGKPMIETVELQATNASFATAAKNANSFIESLDNPEDFHVDIYTFYSINGMYRGDLGHTHYPRMTIRQFTEQFGDIR